MDITGQAVSATASTLTGSAESPGVAHVSNDCVTRVLVARWRPPRHIGTKTVFGLVMFNTAGVTPVYGVDRWYETSGRPGPIPDQRAFYQVGGDGFRFIPPTAEEWVSAEEAAVALHRALTAL